LSDLLSKYNKISRITFKSCLTIFLVISLLKIADNASDAWI